jgi:hypothetical protein
MKKIYMSGFEKKMPFPPAEDLLAATRNTNEI